MGRAVEAIDDRPPGGDAATAGRGSSLNSILARDETRAVFQPIVDLDSSASVVRYEAPRARPGGVAARAP